MAKIYYDLIIAGKWNIDDVPERWLSAVQALIDGGAE